MNYELEECIRSCGRLLQLLEEDNEDIKHALSGEILDKYRAAVHNEKEKLTAIKRSLY